MTQLFGTGGDAKSDVARAEESTWISPHNAKGNRNGQHYRKQGSRHYGGPHRQEDSSSAAHERASKIFHSNKYMRRHSQDSHVEDRHFVGVTGPARTSYQENSRDIPREESYFSEDELEGSWSTRYVETAFTSKLITLLLSVLSAFGTIGTQMIYVHGWSTSKKLVAQHFSRHAGGGLHSLADPGRRYPQSTGNPGIASLIDVVVPLTLLGLAIAIRHTAQETAKKRE